jgi:hypothetical protein
MSTKTRTERFDLKTYLCVSDITPESVCGTTIRVDDKGAIKSIDFKELPYAKFPRNLSILVGSCLELDYHGMMFSVRSVSGQKFFESSQEIEVTLKITGHMIGDNQEEADAKLGKFIKDNINMLLRTSESLDMEIVKK